MPPKAQPAEVDIDYGDALPEELEPEVAPEPEPEPEVTPEPEPEPEVAPEPEPEVAPEPEPVAKGGIPKHRLDFAQQKRREAEERAALLEAELAKVRNDKPSQESPPEAAFDAQMVELDLKIEQARLDGDARQAAQLLGQQRAMERQRTEWLARQSSSAAAQHATEQSKLDGIITQLEEAFPQFVEGAPEYDKDMVEQVLDLHQAFLAKGDRPSQAMAKASSMVLRLNGLLTDDEVTKDVAAAAKAGAKPTNVTKNVAAAKSQPPTIEKTGLDSDKAGVRRKLDLSKMSIEEFEKLGESDSLARTRGDYDL